MRLGLYLRETKNIVLSALKAGTPCQIRQIFMVESNHFMSV